MTAPVASSRTRQAKWSSPLPYDGVELSEDQPGDQPGGLLVAALGQVDPHPQRVVGDGAQRERAVRVAARAEEPRERRPVQQRQPVGQGTARVARRARLPDARLQLALHHLVPGHRLAQRGQRAGLALQQFAQLGEGGETPVRGAVRAEQPGRAPWPRSGALTESRSPTSASARTAAASSGSSQPA